MMRSMEDVVRDVDVLSQVAEAFRLRGSIGGVYSMSPPWGFAFPQSDHATLLVVMRGRIYFEPTGTNGGPIELSPGDVVAMPHGHGCTLRDDPRTPIRPDAVPVPAEGRCGKERASGAHTEFAGLCCQLAGGRANPLLNLLPPLIHCSGSDGRVTRWLEPTVRLLASESASTTPGRTTILNRLAEIVFIQLVRSWIDGVPETEGGWLRALADPQLGLALEAIHSEPGAQWTVASLAARARMSRSAFAERFKNVVGDTPLEYLTRWRMQRAAGLLESGDAPVKEVVAASGYASEAAFRTAFKKWVGVAPGSYRGRRVDGAAG